MGLLEWLQIEEVTKRGFQDRTWIPLISTQRHISEKEFGYAGYRKDCEFIESVVIYHQHRQICENLGWQRVNKTGEDRAWSDGKRFHPPGAFCDDDEEVVGFYPVLRQGFDTGEPIEWHLSQEIEFSLGLLRRGDIWVMPEEDYVEVARIKRDSENHPIILEIRAEHLRDYLCARKAALLLTGFQVREAVEENLGVIPWESNQERVFENGVWTGAKYPILEGGRPVGMTTAILHMWRESVDPSDDVPVMPHPTDETATRSTNRVIHHHGKQLEFASGEIWWKQWIEPGVKSPRIANDKVDARVPFVVGNQANETLSGNALKEYRGWLWFRPGVIPSLLQHEGGRLKWYTQATGSVGPAQNRMIHFGTNSIGLVNALAYKIAELPEWAQRIWSAFSVCPEGGLSEELHASQNLAKPASTLAPEVILWTNLKAVQQLSEQRLRRAFFTELPNEQEFFRTIHRFNDDSFRQVCHLAKELIKIIVERIDRACVNALLGSKLAAIAKELGTIKRLETWLTQHGEDGRKIAGPLVGINDLRQGDAHTGESTAKDALTIFGIPREADDYQKMNVVIIGSVSWAMGWIAKTIQDKGPLS